MNTLLSWLKLILFFALSLGTVLAVGTGKLFTAATGISSLPWKHRVMRFWGRGCLWLLQIKLEVEGTPPESPFLLVTNHLSYLDVAPLWALTDATFVAKSEIRSWPFFGWATRTLGVIFVDRENSRDLPRVNRAIAESLERRQGVIFFPEGTSSGGDGVGPFHAPLLWFAARNRYPVHYASIRYRTSDPDRPASRYVCWWGEMEFFSHFRSMLRLRSIEATVRFGGPPVVSGDRKALADELQERVSGLYGP